MLLLIEALFKSGFLVVLADDLATFLRAAELFLITRDFSAGVPLNLSLKLSARPFLAVILERLFFKPLPLSGFIDERKTLESRPLSRGRRGEWLDGDRVD